jgi:hypothetical protein
MPASIPNGSEPTAVGLVGPGLRRTRLTAWDQVVSTAAAKQA